MNPQQQNDYITLGAAASLSPGRPSANTVWRWCRRGVKSRSGAVVKLEHIRVGRRVMTTQEALHQFFKAVAEADAEHFDGSDGEISANDKPRLSPSPAYRRKAIERAAAHLDAEGI